MAGIINCTSCCTIYGRVGEIYLDCIVQALYMFSKGLRYFGKWSNQPNHIIRVFLEKVSKKQKRAQMSSHYWITPYRLINWVLEMDGHAIPHEFIFIDEAGFNLPSTSGSTIPEGGEETSLATEPLSMLLASVMGRSQCACQSWTRQCSLNSHFCSDSTTFSIIRAYE